MPRPQTKSELIAAADSQWNKMWQLIDSLPDAVRAASFDFGAGAKLKEAHWHRDLNLRDVLVHLYEWHQLLLDWVASNTSGNSAPFLPAPYTWKTYADMNVGFWQKHQNTSYNDSLTMLQDSHQKVMVMIAGFTDEELFEKKHFTWTGTSSLGSYCVSSTASHYDWAIKKIKLHAKTCQLS
ncbi:MAG: ClbS/DfsB family four-helix bundle protein [Coriobacteriales bacterium]|jgi:hypothetical protein|nr:ClbS/DfsB family four-helix bundle protein [Coriobacteriales bacterium]